MACALTACGGGSETVTTSSELTSALSGASSGDVITLRAGTYSGSFEVPTGVTLTGEDGVTLSAVSGAALRVTAGSSPTVIEDVDIENGQATSGAPLGILITGDGEVRIEDVDLSIDRGGGLLFEGDGRLVMRRVAVRGALTDANLAMLQDQAFEPDKMSIVGFLLSSSNKNLAIDFEDVSVEDVAGVGAAMYGVTGTWTDGTVRGVAGTGVLTEETGTVDVSDISVFDGRAISWAGSTVENFGVVIGPGSTVNTTRAIVADIQGIGIVQDDAVSTHTDLDVHFNLRSGVWVQNSPASTAMAPAISLDGALVFGNGGSAIQLNDVGGAGLTRTVIAETRPLPTTTSTGTVERISDALQINDTSASGTVVLDEVFAFGHGRVALLSEGMTTITSVSMTQASSFIGPGEIDPAWACATGMDGVVTCTRTAGAAVDAGWTCSDTAAGLSCDTLVPALMSSDPALQPPAEVMGLPAFVPGSSRVDVLGIVGIDGFGTATRLFGTDTDPAAIVGIDGFGTLSVAAVVGLEGFAHSPTWTCSMAAGTRTCLWSQSNDDDRSVDNPTHSDGPGWSCANDAMGRTCRFEALGVVEQSGATSTAMISLDADTVARDAARSMAVNPDDLVVQSSLATVPGLAAIATQGIVGANGFATTDGNLGGQVAAGGFTFP